MAVNDDFFIDGSFGSLFISLGTEALGWSIEESV